MASLGTVLKELMAQQNLSASELARRTGIGQPVIFRMLSGETDNPKVATLSPLASYFGVTINQLIGETPLTSTTEFTTQPHQIPILSWDQAHNWEELLKNPDQLKKAEWISASNIPIKQVYALKIKDNAMAPLFTAGSILLIHGIKKPKNGDYAIIQPRRSKDAIFRQVLIDEDFNYLKPLNPDSTKFKMKIFSPGDHYLGVLIQARHSF